MYIVKVGSFYLTSDGSFSSAQSDARKFDTAAAADDAIVHSTPRRVKLIPRRSADSDGGSF